MERTNISALCLILSLVGLFVSEAHLAGHHTTSDHDKRCEEITVPMCRNIGYNFTSMPNQFHHETQDEAGLEVHQFYPLVEISCSEDLKFFLCSLYTPICMEDYQGSVPACRSVCERAKQGCEPLMIQYGFSWPEHMNCSKFPVYGDPLNICMDARMTHGGLSTHPDHSEDNHKPGKVKVPSIRKNQQPTPYTTEQYGSAFPENRANDKNAVNSNRGNKIERIEDGPPPSLVGSSGCRCDCREPYFLRIRNDPFEGQFGQPLYPPNYFNHSRIETAGGLAPSCAASCSKGPYNFTDAERENGLWWINVIAVVCVATCLLTFLTYLIDSQRFRYPERAIIFLAVCYVCIAVGYLLRLRLGHAATACDGAVIRYQRTGPTPASCLLSFILLYFFGMASAYWWLILTLTWFLAAGLKWGSEAITGYAQYFHLLAWLLPTAQSVAILCLGAIDGDPFAGVCYVGNQSRANLLIFVITPLCVCIAIGSLFLIAGFVALFRIRRAIRQRQAIRVKADTLEKLMMKIGMSSIFYIVPESVVLACHIYEYIYRPSWEKSLTCICANEKVELMQPHFSMILLKYIMSLIIGITSGFWIWSGKTLDSWMQFYARLACCRGPFGSPSSSRSGASQLLPNMGYYGRGMPLNIGNASLPLKTQTVNLAPMSANNTPQHLLHATPHHHHLHSHHGLELQSRQTGQQLIHPLPSLPPSLPPPLPPPPPPLMMSTASRHGGSLTGSQFTHLIGSINGNGSNANSKVPLSHV